MGYILKNKELKSIYKSLGIEEKGKVQLFLGKTVADHLKAYVSLDSGTQARQTKSIASGKKVVIDVPYARFQAGGKVMIGVKSRSPWAKRGEKKILTRRNLTYHNNSLRGAHPFERMKADKYFKILDQVTSYARRIDNG